MSLELSIKDCCAGIRSDKATERKKSAESLKAYLAGNAAPALLSNNTINKKGFGWNNVFDDITEYILKECEKFETSKTFENNKALASNLLYAAVSNSNKGQSYIKWEKVIDSSLFILKSKRLHKAFGDVYMILLHKYILTNDYFVEHLNPQAWDELLDSCVTALCLGYSIIDEYTNIRLIWLIIKNALKHCQFINQLREILPKIKTIFWKFNDKKVQEPLLEIAVLLVAKLSVECRLTICDFSENVIPIFLRLYDQNLDKKKKKLLFAFLAKVMQVHHPHNKLQSEEGSLAHDWNNWRNHLLSILELICSEVNCLQKQSESKYKLAQVIDIQNEYKCFTKLAALVYYQCFNNNLNSENETACASKKPRLTISSHKSFNDLIEALQHNDMPWLLIIAEYLKFHGHTVSKHDFQSLLTVLGCMLMNNKIKLNWVAFSDIVKYTIERAMDSSSRDNVTVMSLWNLCIRYSASSNEAHESLSIIIKTITDSGILEHKHMMGLLKLFYDKTMPVANHSITLLNTLFYRHFNKLNSTEDRLKCWLWVTSGEFKLLDPHILQELIMRLLSKDKVEYVEISEAEKKDMLYYTLFDSVDNCILWSEFEHVKISQPPGLKLAFKYFDMNETLYKEIEDFIINQIHDFSNSLIKNEANLSDCTKYIHNIFTFCDMLMKCNIITISQLKDNILFKTLKLAFTNVLVKSFNKLKDNTPFSQKILLVNNLQAVFMCDFEDSIHEEIGLCMNQELFHRIHQIISKNEIIEECDVEMENSDVINNSLRCTCIYFLAAYCRKSVIYRNEILDMIMDDELYNLNQYTDVETAFKCLELLTESSAKLDSLESIWGLLQYMCKELFRNPTATFRTLKILNKILEEVCCHSTDILRNNCFIMITSYRRRCEQLFYPPPIAALLYKILSRIEEFKLSNQNWNINSMETLKLCLNSDVHSLRLYASQLVTNILNSSADTLKTHINSVNDIFIVNISDQSEVYMKDEVTNRTATVLHCYLALAISKQTYIHTIISNLLNIHKTASLNVTLTKKVLNRITQTVASKKAYEFLNQNILLVLQFWFDKKYKIGDLPIDLFGFNNMEDFVTKHVHWLATCEVLWSKDGNFYTSDVLAIYERISRRQVPEIISEKCFCNMVAVCLPYIVAEKYYLDVSDLNVMRNSFSDISKSALTMFESLKQILNTFDIAFTQFIGQYLMIMLSHLFDKTDIKNTYNIDLPATIQNYYFTNVIFKAIVRYLGDVINNDLMEYLCKNQPLVVCKIILMLWRNVDEENIFEFKLLALHRFLTILRSIPTGCPTDTFVFTLACKSLMVRIRTSTNAQEISVYATALQIILKQLIPNKNKILHDILPQILSALVIKKDEGYCKECLPLLSYLVVDMNADLKDSVDLVDGTSALTQELPENSFCSTKQVFADNLSKYISKLHHYSFETLHNLYDFLKNNKDNLVELCNELDSMNGLAEYYQTSVIHQIINALTLIIKNSAVVKTTIVACNCLAEIGIYDLKTLAMVAPPDSKRVTNLKPSQYLAVVAVKNLSELVFDEKSMIANHAVKALQSILKFKEGQLVNDVNLDLLKPFISKKSSNAVFDIDNNLFCKVNDTSIWIPSEQISYIDWLTQLTVTLFSAIKPEENYITTLKIICSTKPFLCEKLIPALIGLIIRSANSTQIRDLGVMINNFFGHFMTKFSEIENGANREGNRRIIQHDDKLMITLMLDVVDFVRLQKNQYIKWRKNVETHNYLNIDYKAVAWAANEVNKSFFTIYYGELWCMAQNDGIPPSSPNATAALDGGELIQEIFQKSFASIGDIDAIAGCGNGHLTSDEGMRKHLMRSGHSADSLLVHDIALSFSSVGENSSELNYGVARSLHQSGMYHLAAQYIKSLTDHQEMDDIKYDCFTQLGNWSLCIDTAELETKILHTNTNIDTLMSSFRYACLKDCLTIHSPLENDERLQLPLQRAKLAISKLCQQLNMDHCQNVYNIVHKLQLFNEIESYFQVRCNNVCLAELLNDWRLEHVPIFQEFKYIEGLILQRSSILEHAAKMNSDMIDNIVDLQLQYAELGLLNNRTQMSQRLVAVAKKLQSSAKIALVEGQVLWSRGNKEIALSIVNKLIETSSDSELVAAALRQYGSWMVELKYESAKDIINKYLQKSLNVLGDNSCTDTRLKIYSDIARYADSEYKQVLTYTKSEYFIKKVKCMESMKGTAQSLKSKQVLQQMSTDERKAIIHNEKLSIIDAADIENTYAMKTRYLHLAMRYYLLSLIHGEENNLTVFRVISLWLDNSSIEINSGNEKFGELLSAVPSRKYLPVLPQIAPRLSNDDVPFTQYLNGILTRCAMDHPHHTLPILFSIKNSEKDMEILNSSAGMSRSGRCSMSSSRNVTESRIAAAHLLVKQLAESDKSIRQIINQMETLCDALISFANYATPTKQLQQSIPKAETITKLKNVDSIPIPTITLPIRTDCVYTDFASIASFSETFDLVGGVNCPKKLTCRGSDGVERTILLKGKDDLRQDAVMQQVFGVVNTLLQTNNETKKHKFLIRTYKIVPLSRKSGVLEWCEGTMPIGVYLAGPKGSIAAHARYRPQDISCASAREILTKCYKNGESNAQKLAAFLGILKNLKPVFHYFFIEHYLDPVTWYERRLAYTKSVATSSMVGYVMGIGDRHLNNILIDTKSAEVIHIDFGIAFDQGQALPTPETIPFRLTQDLVSAFGPSGVEGVFRRSCEKTMQLLRDNHETLLTLLEVLLCDPLCTWTLPPLRAERKQNITASTEATKSESGNRGDKIAERALLAVMGKLGGTEAGGVAVAVAGQVAALLHRASDPDNLSRLFHGWQAYL